MHNRAEARYTTFLPELIADLQRAIERALRARASGGTTSSSTRASGSARPPTTTSSCCATSARCALLGRPILLGTQPQVDPRSRPGPAGRRAAGGDAGHDRARHRRRRRHRPRPRRAGQRPRGPDERRDRPRHLAARPAKEARRERPDRPGQHAASRVATAYYDYELLNPQPFEVDVELVLNLQPAGVDDDLEKSVDYGKVYEAVRQIVESTSYRLLEALAEAISHELLADFEVERGRRPGPQARGPARAARSTTRASRSAAGGPRASAGPDRAAMPYGAGRRGRRARWRDGVGVGGGVGVGVAASGSASVSGSAWGSASASGSASGSGSAMASARGPSRRRSRPACRLPRRSRPSGLWRGDAGPTGTSGSNASVRVPTVSPASTIAWSAAVSSLCLRSGTGDRAEARSRR